MCFALQRDYNRSVRCQQALMNILFHKAWLIPTTNAPTHDKICHDTRKVTTGLSHLSNMNFLFTLWCPTLMLQIVLLSTLKLDAVIIRDLLVMKQSTTCLIYPPSLLAVFWSHLCLFFCSTCLPFHFSILSLWLSSPPRCEQVIGWSPPCNPFVVGKCTLLNTEVGVKMLF